MIKNYVITLLLILSIISGVVIYFTNKDKIDLKNI